MKTAIFYGYKHWTLEDTPRCFNVGKGRYKRPFSKQRNHKWHAIVKRHGLRIEVCVGFLKNEDVCAWEIEQIAMMGTFSTNHSHNDSSDIGCNFTKGGEGSTGKIVSSVVRKRIGDAQRGKPKSVETRKKISNALSGRKLSKVTRKRMSNVRIGHIHSEQTRASMRDSAKNVK